MSLNSEIVKRETLRLGFIKNRDGLEGMLNFAKQGYNIYRSCRKGEVRKKYGKEYRRELIVSCLVYRGVIRNEKLFS